ncbi:aminophospholipid translocase [Pichia californica]|uniref:Phospholipid-transporting ATPase n=1 Tax=Pichia californica TaxID=460514 RepID=A0A9P7BHG4_9ASCO|nr:aminophospholipid translocase [[Candida] californica]
MSYNNQFIIGDDENDDSIDLLGDDIPYSNSTVKNSYKNTNSNKINNESNINSNDTMSVLDPFSDKNHIDQFDDVFDSSTNYKKLDNPFDNSNELQSDTHDTIINDRDAAIGSNDAGLPYYNPSLNDLTIPNNQNKSGLKEIYKNMKDKFGLTNYNNVTLKSRENANSYDDLNHDNRQLTPPPPVDEPKSDFNFFDIRKYFGKNNNDDDKGPRIIYINNSHENSKAGFSSNHISTTKYNAVTFLPKFLFEQFSKYANLFFLFTSCIQQVPGVTPTNRYTTIGTLLVVLLVSAVKEMSEDIKRNSSDNELNKSKVLILDNSTGEYHERKWINVKVGDIVKINNGESLPADLILLSSSEPDGLCYIETANLDGETNLKIKQPRKETVHLIDPQSLVNIKGKVMSERPNSSLYTYEGTMELNNNEFALSPDQLILRGASLRNTMWIQGIVIFTGHQTKLMRNATATPIKKTDVERIINLQIIALFGILVFLAIVSSLGNVMNLKINKKDLSYLYMEGTNKLGLFFLDILTYWILYSNLVPISLFVTVEIIKYYQAYLIASDLDMYCEENDTPTVVRTSSLVEELGQIKYVFSDKTGTLTRNIMEFKTCSIGGRCYIEKIPEDKEVTIQDGIEMGYFTFDQLKKDLLDSKNSNVIDSFLTLLSTCHTVIPEIEEDGTIKYQAASPDEGALVEGAAMLNYKFHTRKPSSIIVSANGKDLTYELLNICEFNSTRKRMSTLFRCPDGKIRLYVKGADSVIFERLSSDNEFVDATTKHLEEFAVEGLRTLCIATRIISQEEYENWSKVYQQASVSLENRAEELDKAAELIEKDLFLLGATAIEDKLQDGVPETISVLQDAGINVWVLTGDRQETAINVGMSCKLLSEDMNLLIINEDSKDDTCENMIEKLTVLHGEEISQEDKDSLALVIDGKSLGFALESDLEDMFLDIGTMCKAVICCRVSPLQKALVVKLVKRKKKALLLAIGDGANDVSMIQAAHVGVGISGMEGAQASRSADFAIGQFKYLKKLLLVHGSWSYQRISLAILYSFYKNITLYMCQFWYVFSSGFSGQSIVESWSLTLYNVLFVVLPPFVIGIFDQYLTINMLYQYPQLYKIGQEGHFFNVEIFWSWAVNGFYHSAIIYVSVINIYKYGNQFLDGEIGGLWVVGIAIYTVCLLTSLGKAALISSQWTKFTILAIPGSFALWFVAFPLYAVIAPKVNVSKEYYGIMPFVYGSGVFWLTIIVVPTLCLMRDFLYKFYKRQWNPEFYHIVQKIQKNQVQTHRPKFSSFQRTIRKVRQVHRMRRQRGFAFSQVEGQENIVRKYDTTKRRGVYGELE